MYRNQMHRDMWISVCVFNSGGVGGVMMLGESDLEGKRDDSERRNCDEERWKHHHETTHQSLHRWRTVMGTEGFFVPAFVHDCHEERRNPAPAQPRGLGSEEREGQIPSGTEGQIPSGTSSRSSRRLDWGWGVRAQYHDLSMQTESLLITRPA